MTARVLATERDTDRGQAVYDIRIQAPNAITYVVHVSRTTDRVLWVNRAERQAQRSASGTQRSGRREKPERESGD